MVSFGGAQGFGVGVGWTSFPVFMTVTEHVAVKVLWLNNKLNGFGQASSIQDTR